MAAKTYRLMFGGDAVDETFYGDVVSLTVEESTAAAGAFSLRLISRRQSDGAWSYTDDVRLSLFNDVSIQIGFSDGPGASLSTVFSGYVTGFKVSLNADPDSSFVEVEGMDPSVLMSVEEKISTWPNLADSDIAQHIVGGYDLPVTADDTPTQHLEDDTTVVQRGTDLDFVRMLARRNGLEFYFEAGSPGTPVAYFRAPQLQGTPQADLVVQLADDTNLKNFFAQVSGLRPLNVKTEQMDIQANSANSATVSGISLQKLGDRDAASLVTGTLGALVQPKEALAQTLVLGPPTSQATELQTLAQAVRDEAGWLIHASGEINSEAYQNVLRPRRTVLVRGAGQTFNGTYYVTRVTHEIKADGDYSQSFEARRNALGTDGTELFGGNGTGIASPGF